MINIEFIRLKQPQLSPGKMELFKWRMFSVQKKPTVSFTFGTQNLMKKSQKQNILLICQFVTEYAHQLAVWDSRHCAICASFLSCRKHNNVG